MEILNKTPFQAKNMLLQDESGRDQLVVAIKASYEFSASGELKIAEEQQPIFFEDEYYGDPESSSLKYECEATVCKPTTNLILNGSVYGGNNVSELDVGIRAQNVKKVARVFGPRVWMKKFGVSALSKPANFDVIPLLYEKAFGGIDGSSNDKKYHENERRNYVGMGFTAKKTGFHFDEIKVPNIEDPNNLISSYTDRPAPIGFGFVSPNWEPRVKLAGTYDKDWQEKRAPLLPGDFDHAFFNSASAGMTAENYFHGGELIEMVNISGYAQLRVEVPRINFDIVKVTTTQDRTVMTPYLNTVLIEPDEKRISLLWKATECVYKEVKNLWFTRVKANV